MANVLLGTADNAAAAAAAAAADDDEEEQAVASVVEIAEKCRGGGSEVAGAVMAVAVIETAVDSSSPLSTVTGD